MDEWEYVGIFQRRRQFKGRLASAQNTAWGYRGVWEIPSARRRGHPAPFPEVLAERLIEMLTDPGDVVLDPFLGSGATLVAAQHLGRRCVGLDKERDYLSLVVERWRAEQVEN